MRKRKCRWGVYLAVLWLLVMVGPMSIGCGGGGGGGGRAEVVIQASNNSPIADAGPDQTVPVGTLVQLDGSQSRDPDPGDTLRFQWTLTTKPAGSGATLSDPTSPQPRFMADVAGTYESTLVVSDGKVQSLPDRVTITARPGEVMVAVSSQEAWQDTGLKINAGDTITIAASGSIRFDTAGRTSTPDGLATFASRNPDGTCNYLVCSDSIPINSLVGRIGSPALTDFTNGFFVGASFRMTATTAGALLLGYNDGFVRPDRRGLDVGGVGDNSGAFSVTVTVTSTRATAVFSLVANRGASIPLTVLGRGDLAGTFVGFAYESVDTVGRSDDHRLDIFGLSVSIAQEGSRVTVAALDTHPEGDRPGAPATALEDLPPGFLNETMTLVYDTATETITGTSATGSTISLYKMGTTPPLTDIAGTWSMTEHQVFPSGEQWSGTLTLVPSGMSLSCVLEVLDSIAEEMTGLIIGNTFICHGLDRDGNDVAYVGTVSDNSFSGVFAATGAGENQWWGSITGSRQ